MWTIYNDGSLLFDPRLPEYKLTAATMNLELNKADSLNFTIHPSHPGFGSISRLKGTIEVRNENTVFRGRMLNDGAGWVNEKATVCEGALAWLNDSVQRPFTFPVDENHASPADYFAFLLGRHNEQEPAERQIQVGICTVEDPNNYITRSDTQYSSTMKLIREGLLNKLGGYLYLRYESGTTYLDYLADFDVLSNQPVQFGLNMLSIKTVRKGADICTAILPLGHMDESTGERLTISGLADETTSNICKAGDIVYSVDAETQYGARIVKVVTWDDVTIDTNLLAKAKARLAQDVQLPATITLTAADLSAAGYEYNSFALGRYVDIIDDVHTEHNLLARYLVTKLSVDLLNPANNKLTLGATTYSLTEKQSQSISSAMTAVEANIRKENAVAIQELETRNASAILQAENEIQVYVAANTYSKSETDQLVASAVTSVELTAQGLLIQFDELQQDVEDVASNADARFNALQSYISLAGGKITLGETGNPITLTVENDQIGIYANGNLITYWTADAFVSPGTLRVPVGGRLELGNFAFIPRSSGSLDFKWIGA